MEVLNQSAAAGGPGHNEPTVAHAMQKNRQAYLARFKAQIDHKMGALR